MPRRKTHPTRKNSVLGVPIGHLPSDAQELMAWKAKQYPELFRRAYPEAAFLQKRDLVLEELMKMILSGQLEPGSLASESKVIDRMRDSLGDVSRTPVREALAILVRDGFVRQFPQKGFEVVEVSADEAREALSLCGEVEALAVERLIAMNGSADLALRAAQSIKSDRDSWLGDTGFHAWLAVSAGLIDAARSIERWRQKVHLYSRNLKQFEQDEVMVAATEEHADIAEAISNDPKRAIELLDQHLEHTAVWLGLAEPSEPPYTVSQMSNAELEAELQRRHETFLPEIVRLPAAALLRAVAGTVDKYKTPIENLNLSVRAYNRLKRSGLNTVGQVLEKNEDELLALRDFGQASYDELKGKLIEMDYLEPDSYYEPVAEAETGEALSPLSAALHQALKKAGEDATELRETGDEQAMISSIAPGKAQRS